MWNTKYEVRKATATGWTKIYRTRGLTPAEFDSPRMGAGEVRDTKFQEYAQAVGVPRSLLFF